MAQTMRSLDRDRSLSAVAHAVAVEREVRLDSLRAEMHVYAVEGSWAFLATDRLHCSVGLLEDRGALRDAMHETFARRLET